jgi:hypothetical protein
VRDTIATGLVPTLKKHNDSLHGFRVGLAQAAT